MIKFPSIEQFRTVVRAVTERTRYVSGGGDTEPVFDHTRPLPALTFEGTVKLHGTNAGIVETREGITFQSRERVLSETADNAGFYKWGYENYQLIQQLIANICHVLDTSEDQIYTPDYVAVYGEWCGQGIQSGVAISQLPKMFVIFGVKIDDKWIDLSMIHHIDTLIDNVYWITKFQRYYITIPFNDPVKLAEAVNSMGETTQLVEDQCPVGEHFGVKGVGEGIVWKPLNSDWNESRFWFKVKGDKHSVSKVKKLASVDVEAVKAIGDFVEMTVTEPRLEQGLNNLINEQLKPFEMSSLGDFIRWVITDIKKEESDTITANNLDEKKINPAISKAARDWYIQRFNTTG